MSPPDEPTPPETPRSDAPVDHDDTGLDLARSIARSLARPGARKRRTVSGGKGTGQSPDRGGRRGDPQLSGAHPDDRDPQSLDATIGRLIDDQGWGTDVRVHGVFSRWDLIVGHDVAQHCRPESFNRVEEGAEASTDHGGRLVVRTDSSAWATQMRMLAPTVVRRLNEELGEGTVTRIDVQGPHGPSWKRGRRSVRDGRGPRDTYG